MTDQSKYDRAKAKNADAPKAATNQPTPAHAAQSGTGNFDKNTDTRAAQAADAQREADRSAGAQKVRNDAQEKLNTERGGATNAMGDPDLKDPALRTPVNNPAPGDPDPIYPGAGHGSPSKPTGELPGDGSGYPSNPSVAGRKNDL